VLYAPAHSYRHYLSEHVVPPGYRLGAPAAISSPLTTLVSLWGYGVSHPSNKPYLLVPPTDPRGSITFRAANKKLDPGKHCKLYQLKA